ncbi:MAG: reverse transcriptase domain-containing protein [candidate division Zixibacteria bacterium]|nr:reverse transcriptase domain-containing protein [candidate division Zixibacteria bacterium]
MRNAETCLTVIRKRGEQRLPIDDLYRQLFNPLLYLQAYGKISRNAGAMTPGSTPETVDGMSLAKIHGIIDAVRHERYRFRPVRRTYIPKTNGKVRPLGIPTWSDKLLQEVIRMLLEAYYEPQFSDCSHGFRPERGCHTALRQVYHHWRGTVWFIEGDIRGCFDSIDHEVLLSILRENIRDNRFVRLLASLLKAGYLEDWKYYGTPSGTPQGGIVSPILANIYLDRLDHFIESELLPDYNHGSTRTANRPYRNIFFQQRYWRLKGDAEKAHALRKQMQKLPSVHLDDPTYRRLKYIRYADDFLLGFVGTKTEAEQIKQQLATFLQTQLRLELSEDKTLVTHARSDAARFLGYDVTMTHDDRKHTKGRRSVNGVVSLRVPKDVIHTKCQPYLKHGEPMHRSELLNHSVYDIIAQYQWEYRGIVNFYRMAHNLRDLDRLKGVMQRSLVKTLAGKLRISPPTVYQQYREVIHTKDGHLLSSLAVTIERAGKRPLVARWGGIPLTWSMHVTLDDTPVRFWSANTTSLVERLLADTCELCGSHDGVQVHHIRAMKDLKTMGRTVKPLWVQVMAARSRKTLVLCHSCHVNVHAGRPQPLTEV